MGKVVFIIPDSFFNETVLETVINVIKSAGHRTFVAGIEKTEYSGEGGKKVTPDMTVIEADKKVIYFDAVVVSAGKGAPRLFDYPEVLDILKRAAERKKVIAGIGRGAAVLARAGILKGKRATVEPEDWAVEVLVRNGAEYSEKDIVTDGNIITSANTAAEKLGKAVVEAIETKTAL